ncbi:MAG: hypothetical protein GXN94_05070 [Aquificae bacterium]|nr:hypothetical protein [Aquificota bacterium]
MKKIALALLFIPIIGCKECPPESLIEEQLRPYTVFGTVESFQVLDKKRNGSYCNVDVVFRLRLMPGEIKLADSLIKTMDEDIKKAYTFYLNKIKNTCGNVYEEKTCELRESFRFISGYGDKYWYRIEKEGQFERIRIQ